MLDNCEHVVYAAPRLAELLGLVPGLKMLATSRAALPVSIERIPGACAARALMGTTYLTDELLAMTPSSFLWRVPERSDLILC